MSYWNKSLHREMLTARTNSLLTDLTNETEKLTAANTAFSDLAIQAISKSPSISVIRGIAGKYQAVIDGFMTAVDYDKLDCRTLLGYISEESEDLIFGELYGNWEVAKQNRDNTQSELDTYRKNSTYTTSYTYYDILGNEQTITIDHYPDPFIEWCYNQSIASYQKEMDKWQAKLDRLGEFEDRSGALFANSADFRTYAVKALSDLKDCVSSDGTFKDISYSYALNKLDKLHEQKQEDYLKEWLDKDGNIDMDAVEKFLYQDPDSVTMDQYLAFCKLMDQMSDEEMTDMMNRASRVTYDPETGVSSIEVSKIMQEAAEMNALLWCGKYVEAGYDRSAIDEEKMLRAMAIDAAMQQMVVMAQEENKYTEISEVYKHLPVYVDGPNVYIINRVLISDADGYGYGDREAGVAEIFKKIIAEDTKGFFPYLEWVAINVDNGSCPNYAIDKYVSAIFDRLGGSDSMADYTKGQVSDYLKGKLKDKILEGVKDLAPNSVVVGPALEFIEAYAAYREEYLKNNANAKGKEALILRRFCDAFYIQGTFVSYTGNGYISSIQVKNIHYNSAKLQMAIAAYNEYNGGVDIDINWVYNYENCTEEQKKALDNYIEWFGTDGQAGVPGTRIEDYEAKAAEALNSMRDKFPTIPTDTYIYNLTPGQFKELQNYMADPENYKVNTSLWE